MINGKYVLGLTGGIATGKTTASEAFRALGCYVVDADQCARDVVAFGSKGLKLLVEHFGVAIALSDGSLNRGALRKIVFTNQAEYDFLNATLQPLIKERIVQLLSQCGNEPYIVLVAPLLFEYNLELLTDRVLCMDIEEEVQITRAMMRDKCSYEIARSIVTAQIPREMRLAKSHDVLRSDLPTPQKLVTKVKKLHDKYIKIFTK